MNSAKGQCRINCRGLRAFLTSNMHIMLDPVLYRGGPGLPHERLTILLNAGQPPNFFAAQLKNENMNLGSSLEAGIRFSFSTRNTHSINIRLQPKTNRNPFNNNKELTKCN